MSVSRSRVEEIRVVTSALARVGSVEVAKIAAELGVSERTVWRWRSGDAIPRADAIRYLVRRLGLNRPEPAASTEAARFAEILAACGGDRGQAEHVFRTVYRTDPPEQEERDAD